MTVAAACEDPERFRLQEYRREGSQKERVQGPSTSVHS